MSLAAPVTFSVIAGALPPGITLDQDGFISGSATTPGPYVFTVQATGSDGQSTTRAYGISVAGIDQVVLTEAELDESYFEQLTQTGMTGAVTWAITDGVLPAGITLDSDGTLEGTPTEDGDFPIEIAITNGTDTCHRVFVLTVEASTTQAYWRLEGPTAANHDEITGDLLTYNNFGAILTSPPAVVGNGLDIGGAAFCTFQQQGSTLAYTAPTGFSVAMWIRWSSAATGNEGFTYQWDNIGLPGFLSWIVGTGEYHFANLGVDTTGNTALLAADVFHFVVFTYDPADNNLRASFDGGAFVILGNPGVVTPVADATAYLLCGNEAVLYDEVQLYSFPLRPVDVAYLFNGGAGRVYPPVFPP